MACIRKSLFAVYCLILQDYTNTRQTVFCEDDPRRTSDTGNKHSAELYHDEVLKQKRAKIEAAQEIKTTKDRQS
jgi:hypothetical protein